MRAAWYENFRKDLKEGATTVNDRGQVIDIIAHVNALESDFPALGA